jgi:hypothetical protein
MGRVPSGAALFLLKNYALDVNSVEITLRGRRKLYAVPLDLDCCYQFLFCIFTSRHLVIVD